MLIGVTNQINSLTVQYCSQYYHCRITLLPRTPEVSMWQMAELSKDHVIVGCDHSRRMLIDHWNTNSRVKRDIYRLKIKNVIDKQGQSLTYLPTYILCKFCTVQYSTVHTNPRIIENNCIRKIKSMKAPNEKTPTPSCRHSPPTPTISPSTFAPFLF